MRRVLGTALAALAITAAPAAAGDFTVDVCGPPAWTGEGPSASATCMPMRAEVNGVDEDVRSDLVLRAPADLRIAGYRLQRAVRVGPAAQGWAYAYRLFEDASAASDSCNANCRRGDATGGPGEFARSGLSVRELRARAWCRPVNGGPRACPQQEIGAHVEIHAASLTLTDDLDPAFDSAPAGPLVDASAPRSGVIGAAWSATDRGGGIREVVLEVDGRAVQTHQPCATPATGMVPCPLSASGVLSFDTATVPDGRHTVLIRMRDVAGGEAVHGPVSLVTDDAARRGAPNGSPATRLARVTVEPRRRGETQIRTRYGAREHLIGYVRDTTGRPIAGATVELIFVPSGGGAPRLLGRTTTAVDGSWSRATKARQTGLLVVSYRAFANDARPSATGQVEVIVRPRVILRRDLTGKVSSGRSVWLQRRSGSRWRTVERRRPRSSGEFVFRTRRPGRYRAWVPADSVTGSPAGASRSQTVI